MRGLLVLGLAILIFGCVSCGTSGRYSSDEVLSSFYGVAKQQALPDSERQEVFRAWGTQIILGRIKHLEGAKYEVEFPDLSLSSTEVWQIQMDILTIQPVNSNALVSALVLFCQDRDDPSPDCQSWLRQLERISSS